MWEAFHPEDYVNTYLCASGVNKTDQNGKWQSRFYAGCPSSDDFLYIFVLPPDGYESTTPPVVRSNHGSFGFAPVDTQVNIEIMPVISYLQRDFDKEAAHRKFEQIRTGFLEALGTVFLLFLIWSSWKIAGKIVALK